MTRSATRSGRINAGVILIVGSLFILLASALLLWSPSADPAGDGALRLYCAAGLKPAIEEVIRQYEAEYGRTVEVQYGGSGTLLSQLEVRPQGVDLYLAADVSYLELAREKGLLREVLPLAIMRPVIAVPKPNPREISSIGDLLDDSVSVGLANPDAAAVGRITRKVLQKTSQWEQLAKHCKVFKPTVNEVTNDVRIGSVDAAIVWDAAVAQYDELTAVHTPELDAATRAVSVGVTSTTQQSVAALRFARYLNARDRGQQSFTAHGFETIEGDIWAQTPKLVVFAGSMFNQAIEDTVQQFEAREGVDITRVYNGCGILVGQMRAGARPDAYFSCDTSFMTNVGDLFEQPFDVSENRLVIITATGNPHAIQFLDDLAQPGLRIGLAHPEKSALGHLTRRMLDQKQLTEVIDESGNVKQDAPQGDFLVNALRTGALDAAVVYESNASPFTGDHLTVVRIAGENALARQPYAVARETEYPATMERLLDALLAAESRVRFEELGFHWVADAPGAPSP